MMNLSINFDTDETEDIEKILLEIIADINRGNTGKQILSDGKKVGQWSLFPVEYYPE